MVFRDEVHSRPDQHMVFNSYATQIEETACMIDEYAFPQADMPPEIGMEWCKDGGVFIDLCTDDIA